MAAATSTVAEVPAATSTPVQPPVPISSALNLDQVKNILARRITSNMGHRLSLMAMNGQWPMKTIYDADVLLRVLLLVAYNGLSYVVYPEQVTATKEIQKINIAIEQEMKFLGNDTYDGPDEYKSPWSNEEVKTLYDRIIKLRSAFGSHVETK
jgi:hypothetical protein